MNYIKKLQHEVMSLQDTERVVHEEITRFMVFLMSDKFTGGDMLNYINTSDVIAEMQVLRDLLNSGIDRDYEV
jgi:hypothetical protein